MLNDDNDLSRRAVESCYRTRKTLVNPIIDWTDDDVWEFIHKYSIPYCELYDQGQTRLGCIGCPMGGRKGMLRDFEQYPKYKAEYLRCFDKMMKNITDRGLDNRGRKTGLDIFNWWIQEADKPTSDLTLFEEDAE